jgi:hypothetical protein
MMVLQYSCSGLQRDFKHVLSGLGGLMRFSAALTVGAGNDTVGTADDVVEVGVRQQGDGFSHKNGPLM